MSKVRKISTENKSVMYYKTKTWNFLSYMTGRFTCLICQESEWCQEGKIKFVHSLNHSLTNFLKVVKAKIKLS